MTTPAPTNPPADRLPEPHVYAIQFRDGSTTWISDLTAVPVIHPDARWLFFRSNQTEIAGFDLDTVISWRRVPFGTVASQSVAAVEPTP